MRISQEEINAAIAELQESDNVINDLDSKAKFFSYVITRLTHYLKKTDPENINKKFILYLLRVLHRETNFGKYDLAAIAREYGFKYLRPQAERQRSALKFLEKYYSFAPIRRFPEPADKKRSVPRKDLNAALAKSAYDLIAILKADGKDAVYLRKVFAQAGYPLPVSTTIQNTNVDAVNVPPQPLLPTVAPKLWADNDEGLPATAFVAKYYSPWIEAGVLSLNAIRACDDDLANAYRNRVSRYPSEAVALVRSTRSDRIEDPQEAIDRVRDAARESAARRRAASHDEPTNVPR